MADDKSEKENTIFDSLSATVKENIGELILYYGLHASKDGEGPPTSGNLDFIVRTAKKVTAKIDNGYDGEGFVSNFYKMFDELTGANEAKTLPEIATAYYRRLKLIGYFMKEYNSSKSSMKDKNDDANNIAIITMIDMVEKYDEGRGIEVVRNEFKRSGYMDPYEGPQSSEEVAAFEKILATHFKKQKNRLNSFFMIGFFCLFLLGFIMVCLEKVTILTRNGSEIGFLDIMFGDYLVVSMIFALCAVLLIVRLFGSSIKSGLRAIMRYEDSIWESTFAPLGESIKKCTKSIQNQIRRIP